MNKENFPYLSVSDYAKLKDLSVDAIYKQIRENRVKFERIGKTYWILKKQ